MNRSVNYKSQAARSCTDVTLSLVDKGSKSGFANSLASAIAVAGPREHAVIDCVAVFYEEGKGGENYRKKNKFRCRIDKEEKGLVKFRQSIR